MTKESSYAASLIGLMLASTAIACGSGSASGSASPSASKLAMPLLFKLEHIDVAPRGLLSVYADGAWTFDSWDTCSKLNGMLGTDERQKLTGFINQRSLDELSAEVGSCPTESFQLSRRNNATTGAFCWTADKAPSNPDAREATQGLSDFYAARIAELKWDGTVKDCKQGGPTGEGGPMPRSAASGSDAPAPQTTK